MPLQRWSREQLATERDYYAAQLARADGDTSARRVAAARLAELDTELARRQASPDGRRSSSPDNRWPQVDLVALIRDAGCTLVEKEPGKFVGDHSCAHGSKSGTCLVVWAHDGKWFCSSCKLGGDAAAWLAHLEGIDYKTAARKLRERFGPGEDGTRERPSQAELLVALAADAEYFHDALGTTYATVRVGDHTETWPIHARGFTLWLTGRFFAAYHKPVNAEALTSAVRVLDYRARFAGPCQAVYSRVAPDGAGGVYLDLCDAVWRAVHITPAGWEIMTNPPVRFLRSPGMQPLPEPVRGGRFDDLRALVNVPDDGSWALVKAWLIAALAPRGPYPVLNLRGEHGSAKSTLARMLRALIDPAYPALRRPPREERDLALAARACWVLAFDNLSHLPDWLSDGLCALATGGGFATRQLYTDYDEALFDAQRPIILNGITDFIHRDDLLDRVVSIELPRIPEECRREENHLWATFQARHAVLLGALLDLLVGALREQPALRLSRLPRMADFARLAVAAERAEVGPGWGEETSRFLAAYRAVRAEAHHQTIEACVIGPALLEWLAEEPLPWEGTATDLLATLNRGVDERRPTLRGWPKTAHHLSGILRRLAPALRSVGYVVEFAREGADRTRLIRFLRLEPPPENGTTKASAASAASAASTASVVAANIKDGEDLRADAALPASVRAASVQRPEDPPVVNHSSFTIDVVGVVADRMVDAVDAADAPDASVAQFSAGWSFSPPHALLDSADAVRRALPELLAAPVLGLDTETTGLDPHRDRLRLVQLATPERVSLIDAFAVDVGLLRPVFDRARLVVGHNLKFDLRFFLAAGLPVPDGACLFDTMLADQVLRGSRIPRGLEDLAAEHLGQTLDKAPQQADWFGPLTPALLAYAARDAATLLPLHDKLAAALDAAALAEVARLEHRALPAVAWLEYSGAPFDTDAWRRLADGALAEKLRLEEELTALAEELVGRNSLFERRINWDAPEHVKRLLAECGITVLNTTENALLPLAEQHPLVRKLLEYREVSKRCGTYGLAVLGDVHPVTGRIHADWKQIGADSGRMACTRPNLQNVPRTPAYRACFKAPPGRVLVKADYSQIELRIAAEIAGDRRMLDAYQRGEDLHTLTAQLVLGRHEVTQADRQAAKALNFGLIYGMGAATLRQHAATGYGVFLSEEEAQRFREAFFRAYPGLRRWHHRQSEGTVTTTTLAGRKRFGVARFTEKLNTPVQGTGADGLKLALALLWETRARCPSAVPVLAVHDELVIECDAEDAAAARAWLMECMHQGMRAFLRHVPVVVEVKIAQDWSGTEASA